MNNSFISPKAQIGKNVQIGHFCFIEDNTEIGDNVIIEHYCIIKNGVKVGKNTVIKSYVELRENTIIGEDCYIDSKVSSSGSCEIGDRVTLRYETILARGVKIDNDCYLSPRVMTNNLDDEKQPIGGAKLGKNCFIGTNAVLQHGIIIGDDVTIGSMAFVNKHCESGKTYIGIPAKMLKEN